MVSNICPNLLRESIRNEHQNDHRKFQASRQLIAHLKRKNAKLDLYDENKNFVYTMIRNVLIRTKAPTKKAKTEGVNTRLSIFMRHFILVKRLYVCILYEKKTCLVQLTPKTLKLGRLPFKKQISFDLQPDQSVSVVKKTGGGR